MENITFLCADGTQIEIPKVYEKLSGTLKNLIKDSQGEDVIPCQYSIETMNIILEFLKYHYENPDPIIEKSDLQGYIDSIQTLYKASKISDWDKAFIERHFEIPDGGFGLKAPESYDGWVPLNERPKFIAFKELEKVADFFEIDKLSELHYNVLLNFLTNKGNKTLHSMLNGTEKTEALIEKNIADGKTNRRVSALVTQEVFYDFLKENPNYAEFGASIRPQHPKVFERRAKKPVVNYPRKKPASKATTTTTTSSTTSNTAAMSDD